MCWSNRETKTVRSHWSKYSDMFLKTYVGIYVGNGVNAFSLSKRAELFVIICNLNSSWSFFSYYNTTLQLLQPTF